MVLKVKTLKNGGCTYFNKNALKQVSGFKKCINVGQ